MEDYEFNDQVQRWTCKECENDMEVRLFTSDPVEGVHLQCSCCDREVLVEGLPKLENDKGYIEILV